MQRTSSSICSVLLSMQGAFIGLTASSIIFYMAVPDFEELQVSIFLFLKNRD